MKLWLISQTENDGYDTYDSAVVAAETEEEARHIHPSSFGWEDARPLYQPWASKPENVSVKLLGEALTSTPAGIILSSFNAS